ncbi:MAG: hypothetical protein GY713_18995 [Actinomycetia bacterium]|nr:hypothetical protein [Actinomycetes bacterium]
MRAYRVLLLIGIMVGLASYGSSLGEEDGDDPPEAMATLDIETPVVDPVVPASVGASDALSVAAVQGAFEALTAADTVAYRLVAISDSEEETSTVTRTGVWQAAAEAATLTTEISLVEKSNSVSPFGQVADALANSDRPSTKVDLVLADGVVTATVEGRSPEVIPAGPKGDITARAMDPNETLLKPLIRAFIQLETGVSMDGGVSYDAVFDADAVSALAVDASLRERLMATGGLTGVGAPATVVVGADGKLGVHIDLTPWWAAVKAEAPAVPATTTEIDLVISA